MKIEARAFPYNTSAVTQRQFEEHLKLYNGYVDKTNEITEQLKTDPQASKANATYSEYRGLKKGETFAISGVILHEAYFQNMTADSTEPGLKTLEAFQKGFGGYEAWKEDFIACCKAARGWCLMVFEQRTGSFRNILLDLHDYGTITGSYPIIIMDMYEHAYFMDYGTDKAGYINAFIQAIDWNVVERRLSRL